MYQKNVFLMFFPLLLIFVLPLTGQEQIHRQDYQLSAQAPRVSHTLSIPRTGLLDIRGVSLDFPFTLRITNPSGVVNSVSSNDYLGQLMTMVSQGGNYTLEIDGELGNKRGSIAVAVDFIRAHGNLNTQSPIQGNLGTSTTQIEPDKYIDWYQYTLPESGKSLVRLESDDFDTYLIVQYPDGNQDYNDDADGSNSALRIEGFGGQTLMVGATSFSSHSTGRYTISAQPVEPPQSISLAQPVRGNFDSSAIGNVEYVFRAPESGRYVFELFSSGADDMITIQDQNQREYTGRARDRLGPMVSRWMEQGEEMIIIPFSYDSGSYRLLISIGEESDGELTLGVPLNGFLNTQDLIDYNFVVGPSPTMILIDLQSNDFDTYLELLTSRGEIIEDDDSYGGDLDYRSFIRYLAEPNEMLTITVRGYSQDDSGSFVLLVDESDVPGDFNAYEPDLLISVDSSQQFMMTGSNHVFQVSLNRGQVISIAMDSDDFDSYLELEGPGGSWSDDDSGGGYNALINLTVPTSGTYTLTARSFGSGGAAGLYQLSVSGGR